MNFAYSSCKISVGFDGGTEIGRGEPIDDKEESELYPSEEYAADAIITNKKK